MKRVVSIILASTLAANMLVLLLAAAPAAGVQGVAFAASPDQVINPWSDPIPRLGDQKLLVVLVDFPDLPGLFSGEQWREYFWGKQGFAAYFRENSYNQLRYTGDMVGMRLGLPAVNENGVAYVRLPYPISYYAGGMHGFDVAPGRFPHNSGGVVLHGLEALDQAGFDFSPYANPQTGEIENLLVIFAGGNFRYTQDNDNSLEATAYRLSLAGRLTFVSRGGQVADRYTLCPDQYGANTGQIARLGVCAHEHGHALGMFDMYDVSYQTTGTGYFDLMSYGAYGTDDGADPFEFSAYARQTFGWLQPAAPGVGEVTLSLPPIEGSASQAGTASPARNEGAIRLNPYGDPNSREYFLLENRQFTGFDRDASPRDMGRVNLCPGLVIWHVDEDVIQDYPERVNTLPGAGGPPHPGLSVVEADGGFEMIRSSQNYGQCTDTWKVGQTWGGLGSASANLWSGAPSGISLTVLSDEAGVLTVQVSISGGAASNPINPGNPGNHVNPGPNSVLRQTQRVRR